MVQATCSADEDSDELPTLVDQLPRITARVTIVVARRDGDVDRGCIKDLAEKLPNSRIVVIRSCRSVWHDGSVEYASVIVDSLIDAEQRRHWSASMEARSCSPLRSLGRAPSDARLRRYAPSQRVPRVPLRPGADRREAGAYYTRYYTLRDNEGPLTRKGPTS